MCGRSVCVGRGASCGVIANVVQKAKTCHDGDSVQVGGCVVGVCVWGGGHLVE